jgi:selenide,water dikinase
VKRLVLAGGGHAHLEVLRRFGERRAPAEVVLVTPYPWFTYSAMVPGLIAGHYALDECTIDLAALCARAGATLVPTQVTALDPKARRIACADGKRIDYDVLSLDVGSRPLTEAASGVERHAIAMRPLERLVKGWNDVLARSREGRVRTITMVGTGAAGLELAFAMHHRLRSELGERAPHFRAGARRRLAAEVLHRGIESHHGSGVLEVGAGFAHLRNGLEFATDAVFWAAGAASHPWIAASGVACDSRGYMLTDDFLQSVSHPEILGAGDCATRQGHRFARAGVFAVRAGPVLAENVRAALDGRPLRPHVPRRTYLALISAGDRYAIAVWDGFSWEGDWVWRWKDRIDRAFVGRYR